jgi:hypothetical protein
MPAIIWLKGWPMILIGIWSFSIGCWMNAGPHAGFIANGLGLCIAGLGQYLIEQK